MRLRRLSVGRVDQQQMELKLNRIDFLLPSKKKKTVRKIQGGLNQKDESSGKEGREMQLRGSKTGEGEVISQLCMYVTRQQDLIPPMDPKQRHGPGVAARGRILGRSNVA